MASGMDCEGVHLPATANNHMIPRRLPENILRVSGDWPLGRDLMAQLLHSEKLERHEPDRNGPLTVALSRDRVVLQGKASMKRFITTTVAAVALLSSTLLGASLAGAQTPDPAALASGNYPVAIHEGMCTSPKAQPKFTLSNTMGVGSDQAQPTTVGTPVGPPVLISDSTVDAKFDDLTGTPQVIAIHASADQYDTLIACGQIGGVVTSADQIIVNLTPVQGSGISGIAFVTKKDDKTQVTVYLQSPTVSGATPQATPPGSPPA